MSRRVPSIILTLLFGHGIGLATTAAAELASVTRALERAFKASSAKALHEVLAEGKKVYLAVPAVHERDGFYGSDQVFYFFESFFEAHPTRSFELVEADVERREGAAFARAQWRYEVRGAEPRSEPLLFTLAFEDQRWVVTEIRSGRS